MSSTCAGLLPSPPPLPPRRLSDSRRAPGGGQPGRGVDARALVSPAVVAGASGTAGTASCVRVVVGCEGDLWALLTRSSVASLSSMPFGTLSQCRHQKWIASTPPHHKICRRRVQHHSHHYKNTTLTAL